MDKIDLMIRNLKQSQKDMEETQIPIITDEHGNIDKECPNEDCLFLFKVNAEDWEANFKDEIVYCPNCKNESPANSYWPSEFMDQFKNQLLNKARK